jgi:hypothetical protein
MRLRILELPLDTTGETATTPFVLVFDRVSVEELKSIGGANAEDNFLEEINSPEVRKATGARGVLFFQYDVELD